MPHVDDGQLHAWLDGETSDIDAEKIDGHLAKCDECTGRLDEIARVHALAGKLVHRAQAEEAPMPIEARTAMLRSQGGGPHAGCPLSTSPAHLRSAPVPSMVPV